MKRFIFALLIGVMVLGSSGCEDKGKEKVVKFDELYNELFEKGKYADIVLEWFGDKKLFGKRFGSLDGEYYEDPNDKGKLRRYRISIDTEKKEIDCWMEDPTELMGFPHHPIKWHKYEIDKTNRTISIYRQRRKGLELVVKVKFVGDKEFKIVGYGDWLSYDAKSPYDEITPDMDEKTKEELEKEADFKGRLGWLISDTNLIYSME